MCYNLYNLSARKFKPDIKMKENTSSIVALKLCQQLCKNSGIDNVLISPFSVSSAVSMLLWGVKGNVAVKVLHFLGLGNTSSKESIYECQQEILQQLQGNYHNVVLQSASKLFIDEGYPLSSRYKIYSAYRKILC